MAYAFIASVFILKTLKLRRLPEVILNAALTTATVFLLLATARLFGWVLSTYQVPVLVKTGILSLTNNPIIIILLINLILLAVGCVMDPGAAIIMLAPTLAPLALSIGMHPIQFGMLMITNLTLGLITPPVGLCLFISADIAETRMESVAKAIMPFFMLHIIVVLLVSYSPELVLLVPKILGFL